MSPPCIPFHLLTKPAGAACNLRCSYCFFLSKEGLYQDDESALMTEQVLKIYIRDLMETAPGPTVEVAWQGGEPLLRGLDFFRRSVELAEQYRKPHQRVTHSIQTNGTLLDDDWAAFFKVNNYLVGLSIDGPREVHDAFRVDGKGDGTFDRVLRGWRCLQLHGVDTNILCTIRAANAARPLDVESGQQRRLGLNKFDSLPQYCRKCPVLFACHGECPRNRFARTPDGEAGLNYLCAGYRAFFMHIDRPMKQINKLLQAGRSADQVMRML